MKEEATRFEIAVGLLIQTSVEKGDRTYESEDVSKFTVISGPKGSSLGGGY